MTLPLPLVDVDARHLITHGLDQTLFVEAGAGSGKTSSLVKRIVNLVAGGVPIGHIAAITFTEAAATELRHRIRDTLEQQGLDRTDQVLVGAAAQVESAPITTLHGFALRLLSDHPVEAGLPPGFGVVDEITSMLAFDESWHLFTGQIGDDLDLLDLQERAAVLGVELGRFVDVARRFDANWDLLGSVERHPDPLGPIEVSAVIATIAELGTLVGHCLDDRDKLAAALTDLAADAADQLDHDPLRQLSWLVDLRWPNRRSGRKDNWVRMPVDDVRQRILEVQGEAEAFLGRERAVVIRHFMARIATYVDAQVERRRDRGELAFHDLLVLARQLLRAHPLVREQLHQRYRHILLDEFQDTDPIQIELAVLLAADGEVGERTWAGLAPELHPGRLVVVGDPKQSIYRFRRADIGVYTEAEAALVDAPTRLVSNFRSVPGVVEVVNQFFGLVIGEGEPGAQPAYQELVAVRGPDPERTEAPVVVVGGPHDRSVPVGQIREQEAIDVAAVICRAMEEGWRIERDGKWVPLRLRDIAVLIPSRLSLPALEAAFSAVNLPFRPETSSLVYATQEVRDVMAAVRAIVDPSSSIDVVAALRSSLFAVGDDDLLAWYQAGGRWDYDGDEIDLDAESSAPAVAEAFAVLRRWHHDRWWQEPSAVVERIVTERQLREAALAEPRPRDRWRRYRFLAEQAREFTATTGGDLHDFVAWVEIQSSDLARVTEPIPAEPDDDAVRVLTVHGSKGLEFPMVVLAGAPTQEQNRNPGTQVLFPDEGAPELKLSKGKVTAGFDVQASVEEVLDQHERVRLHYVAATRARDLLVMSAHHKERAQSIGLRTWETLGQCEGWVGFERQGDERYRVEPPTQLRLTAGTYPETERTWQREQELLLARNEQSQTFSATSLAERLAPDTTTAGSGARSGAERVGEAPGDEALAEEPNDAGGSAVRRTPSGGGPAVGSAVHAVLELIDFDDPVGVDDLVARSAEREGVVEHTQRIGALVAAALQAPTVELARTHPHWRELHVAAPVGEHVIEGFIDLCIDGPDGLIVVDYKTDLIAEPGDIEAKLARYQYQAGTYALALEEVTGRRPAACRFLFIGDEGVTERAVDDLDSVVARLRAELAST